MITKLNNKLAYLWHPTEAIKRCYPSVFRGRSARKTRGVLAWLQ